MADLENDLLLLQPEEPEPEKGDDLGLFKKAEAKRKKKRKLKLFRDIDSILDGDSTSGDDDMDFVSKLKLKGKGKAKADGDLFDTEGGPKKFKNVESKFKPELANLQKILKDNEETSKVIRSVLGPMLSSKARGSAKMIADLLMALNSANNNRLAVVKELSSVKKAIYDLKIKLDKDKDSTLGMPADQFGSQLFDELFKQGRRNVMQTANQYNPSFQDYVNTEAPQDFDNIIDQRLSTETNEYRSAEGNKMIEYESLHPELCVEKSFSTGEIRVIAIDSNGVPIDDYPTPTVDELGRLSFNNESGTCTDITGRTYKVIEVA